jgi:hypothetical protein
MYRSSLFKSWYPRVGRDHNKEDHIFYIEEILFSRTSRPISIRYGTNHLWLKRIKNCPNERPDSHSKGDNLKNEK